MDRTIIQLSVEDWLLEKLMAFRADTAEFEDGGDAEPEPDDEEDGPPFVVDLVRRKVMVAREATPMSRRLALDEPAHDPVHLEPVAAKRREISEDQDVKLPGHIA